MVFLLTLKFLFNSSISLSAFSSGTFISRLPLPIFSDAVIKLLKPGDEVISTNDLYGGTYRLFTKIFEKFQIKFHFTGMQDTQQIERCINLKTKFIEGSIFRAKN